MLAKKNAHPRDENIVFDPIPHKYTILTDKESTYTSVTTWIHSHFEKFDADEIIQKMMAGRNWNSLHKNWGMTPEEIKASWDTNCNIQASAGTDMHYQIECFQNGEKGIPFSNNNGNNNGIIKSYTHKDLYDKYNILIEQECTENEQKYSRPIEWEFFLNYIQDTANYIPYRTEWMVYHEKYKLSGSIDMVYEDPDPNKPGVLWIYDWKRCKNIISKVQFNKYAKTKCISYIPDTNYWHYAIQLNTYKRILEDKYDKKITDLYLVVLHPNNVNYLKIKMPDLSSEIDALLEERLREINSNESKNNIEIS